MVVVNPLVGSSAALAAAPPNEDYSQERTMAPLRKMPQEPLPPVCSINELIPDRPLMASHRLTKPRLMRQSPFREVGP